MALIVVCEDDDTTRTLICAVLSKAGHQVEAFENGAKGYLRLLEGDVELLVSDVQMPGKDGFELVAQVRADKQLMEIPCILLTSLQERAHMRIGMTSGADDYVTKPFKPVELLDAVDIQLKRALQLYALHHEKTRRSVDKAVGYRTNELMALFEERLQTELQSRWVREEMASTQLSGSLLACSILQQEAWFEVLNNTQMADLARHFFNKVSDSAALFNAEHLQIMGDSLLIVFDAKADTPSVHHAARAQRLLQSMATIRSSMNAYVHDHLATGRAESLPSFTCTLVLHQGHLSLGKLDGVTGGIEQTVPVGQDVQLLAKMLEAAQALKWPALLSPTAVKHWAAKGISQNYIAQREANLGQQTMRLYRAE